MKDHDFERDPSRSNCKICGKGWTHDLHMDVVLNKPVQSIMVKGPDGVVVWLSSVLGSTQLSVYEDVDHNPTVSYSSSEHMRREKYINRLAENQAPKDSGIDIC